jgi:hypothetical protein
MLALEIFLMTTLHRPSRKQGPYFYKGVSTAPLHKSGIYSIVACVFVAAGECLPSFCLEMNVYSDLAIPAFGLSVLHSL